jgi:NAD(P)-dependent dehydrogenase (short-subunit alcohol dehydrogenase family)
MEDDMPTLLIFGASRGLGRALVKEHLIREWRVIATVRDAEALQDLRSTWGDELDLEVLDVTDWAAVDALRRRLEGQPIDRLFVNAGIAGRMASIGEVDPGDFSQLMLVNAFAPLRIVDRFVDLVPSGGTIGVMSSGLGSIAENSSGGFDDYRMSKAALNMGLRTIAERRAGDGRTYLAIAPGWVKTDMGGPEATLTIDQSIPRVVDVIDRRTGAGGVAFVDYQDRDIAW